MELEDEKLLEACELKYEDDFFKVFLHEQSSTMICITKLSYIPVESFVSGFQQIGLLIKEFKTSTFVFDKRALRAFHQPTMEWYFVEWKQKMYEIGLKHHRKILPSEEWFEQCVEAGKASILRDNPNLDIGKFDIKYCGSLQESINNVVV